MGKANSFISLLLGTALAAAAVLPDRQKAYPVVTSVKDGVKTITNPDYPRDGRFSGKLIEEMSCGEEAKPEAAMLNRPLDLKVDDQGRIYVMDWGDMHVKAYDSQGRFLWTISRQGQGPGEFETPAYFSLMTGGKVCILDGRQRRVIILTNEGQYVSGFPVDGFFRSLALDGQDRLYLAKWRAVEEIPKLSAEFREVPYLTSIFRTDATGKNLVHLTDFQGEVQVMKAMSGGGVMGGGGLFTIVWNVNRQGTLYGGFNETYRLGAYGLDGKIEFIFGREFMPLKNPQYRGQVGQKKTMPAFARTIVFDEDENLWLELYKDDKTKGTTYDIFSPEGIYLKQIKLDQRIFQFKNGKVYSLVRPDDGYPSIKRFRLELTSD
ncbi:MAG: 6-bladed beta-propeller [Candidatus Aminicenantes bacterium]|nr:6-bladed beta-propeller [Candidatus Aminicenantes bacterium]